MAVADRDELWEVQCQCIHCKRLTMCTISLSLVKPGEAIPGPYSLMVLRRRASRSPSREKNLLHGHIDAPAQFVSFVAAGEPRPVG